MLTRIALFALTLAMPALALAYDLDCQGQFADGRSAHGEFSVVDTGLHKAESVLHVNGKEIPRVRRYCVYGHGGYRCPHRLDNASYELYPQLDQNGNLNLHVIVTYGDNDPRIESAVLACDDNNP